MNVLDKSVYNPNYRDCKDYRLICYSGFLHECLSFDVNNNILVFVTEELILFYIKIIGTYAFIQMLLSTE